MSLNRCNAKEYRNMCHKNNLSGPFGYFLFYVVLTISLILAGMNNRNVLITQQFHAAPIIKQIKIFSGILTTYFNCKYFSYIHKITSYQLGCLLGISPSARNLCRGNKIIEFMLSGINNCFGPDSDSSQPEPLSNG